MVIIQIRTEQNASLWAVCDRIGCQLAVKQDRHSDVYGLSGNTFPVKDAIKAAGFRFDGQTKVWWAPSADAFNQIKA